MRTHTLQPRSAGARRPLTVDGRILGRVLVGLLLTLVMLTAAGSLVAQDHGAPAAEQPEHAEQPETAGEPGDEAHAGDHGEGEAGLFSGNIGNAVWTLVIFAALLYVLGKFAWGPILEGLQGREQFIRESLQQAKTERDEAHSLLEKYEEKLAEARGEVEEILDEARRDASAVRQREEQKAKEEAEKMLARAKREIDIATETAVKNLYAQASRLSVDVAQKILQRELKPEDHARLIDDAVRSFESRQAN